MDLKKLEMHWDTFGKTDPLWAVLTDPSKKGKKWDPDEFFLTGQEEISAVLNHVASRGYKLRKGKALDFGCGAGRLTQALCDHFQECVGVDIAPSMIEVAEKYNRHGRKCQYFLNRSPNLELFPDATFDFIYTGLVLQHIEPVYSKKYIEEFFRVLAPGGCAVFQVPAGMIMPRKRMPDSSFCARICASQAAIKMRPGSVMTLAAKVQNASPNRWPVYTSEEGGGVFNLGNHWLDLSGSLLVLDDGRVTLPKSLEPQEEVELELTVNVPSAPGTYLLELDMVLEGVSWFKDKGSPTVRLLVEAEDAEPAAQSQVERSMPEGDDERVFVPRMEMYGIPKETILALIAAADCDVLETLDDYTGGPGWAGFRYFVTKPETKRTLEILRQEISALQSEIASLRTDIDVLRCQREETAREHARNLALQAEMLRQQEERSAMLEERCAVQKVELEWLYRWIPVNRFARRLLFGRNLRSRLIARLRPRP